MIKVATIFGITGACRREEFTKLTLDDIEEKYDVLIVTLSNTKTHVIRKLAVCNYDDSDTRYTDLYKKYKLLRPDNTTHRRFFVAYKDGKCTKQCVGLNSSSFSQPLLIHSWM